MDLVAVFVCVVIILCPRVNAYTDLSVQCPQGYIDINATLNSRCPEDNIYTLIKGEDLCIRINKNKYILSSWLTQSPNRHVTYQREYEQWYKKEFTVNFNTNVNKYFEGRWIYTIVMNNLCPDEGNHTCRLIYGKVYHLALECGMTFTVMNPPLIKVNNMILDPVGSKRTEEDKQQNLYLFYKYKYRPGTYVVSVQDDNEGREMSLTEWVLEDPITGQTRYQMETNSYGLTRYLSLDSTNNNTSLIPIFNGNGIKLHANITFVIEPISEIIEMGINKEKIKFENETYGMEYGVIYIYHYKDGDTSPIITCTTRKPTGTLELKECKNNSKGKKDCKSVNVSYGRHITHKLDDTILKESHNNTFLDCVYKNAQDNYSITARILFRIASHATTTTTEAPTTTTTESRSSTTTSRIPFTEKYEDKASAPNITMRINGVTKDNYFKQTYEKDQDININCKAPIDKESLSTLLPDEPRLYICKKTNDSKLHKLPFPPTKIQVNDTYVEINATIKADETYNGTIIICAVMRKENETEDNYPFKKSIEMLMIIDKRDVENLTSTSESDDSVETSSIATPSSQSDDPVERSGIVSWFWLAVICGICIIIIIIMAIVSTVLKRSKQTQRTTYKNLSTDDPPIFPISTTLENTYCNPADNKNNPSEPMYSQPYSPQNPAALYSVPIPKHKRNMDENKQPQETLYAEIGFDDYTKNEIYSEIASRPNKKILKDTTKYASISEINQELKSVLSKQQKGETDDYVNTFDGETYVNSKTEHHDNESDEPNYCEVKPMQ